MSGEAARVSRVGFQIGIGRTLSRPRKRQGAQASRKEKKARPKGSGRPARPRDSPSIDRVRDGEPRKSGDNSRHHRYNRRCGPASHRWPSPRGRLARRFRQPVEPPSCASTAALPSDGIVDPASDDSRGLGTILPMGGLSVKWLSWGRGKQAGPVGAARRVAPYVSGVRHADNWTVASHADKINRAV